MSGHRVQELCESRGGRPGLPIPNKPTVSVDIKQHSANVTGLGKRLKITMTILQKNMYAKLNNRKTCMPNSITEKHVCQIQ